MHDVVSHIKSKNFEKAEEAMSKVSSGNNISS